MYVCTAYFVRFVLIARHSTVWIMDGYGGMGVIPVGCSQIDAKSDGVATFPGSQVHTAIVDKSAVEGQHIRLITSRKCVALGVVITLRK